MKLGDVLKKERERKGLSAEAVARRLDLSPDDYEKIEDGDPQFEAHARTMMKFAEAIEQPVFNLFYPCGLPFQELDDYEIRVKR